MIGSRPKTGWALPVLALVTIILWVQGYNKGLATTSSGSNHSEVQPHLQASFSGLEQQQQQQILPPTTRVSTTANDDDAETSLRKQDQVQHLVQKYDAPPARSPHDENPLRASRQAKRGYESMITQLAKPLQCVNNSRWRGPNVRGFSVEERLEEALSRRGEWESNIEKAIEYCGNGRPMMSANEFAVIYHLLREGDLMLEWGAGRSSCPFAYKVGELHSVDDSSTWVTIFRTKMTLLENQILHWMPSFEAAGSARPPSSLDEYHLYMNVPFFIAPSCFADSNVKFDVILVDGRVRPQCAYQALLLLKRDGVLIIHDWETRTPPLRPFYRIVLRWFELLHTEENTAIFRIRLEKSGREHHATPGVLPSWWTKKQPTPPWNMMSMAGVAYTEPFETPGYPRGEEANRIQANWKDVKASPGFKYTKDVLLSGRTKRLRL